MTDIPIVDLEAEADEDLSYGDQVSDFTVVDTDTHFLTPAKEMIEYMEEPWRTRSSSVISREWTQAAAKDARDGGRIGQLRRAAFGGLSAILPGTTGDRQQYGKIIREHSAYPDAPQEIERIPDAMEFLGADYSIQISHLMLVTAGVLADDARVPQFLEGYTQYMIDNVLDPENGIYGFLPIPKNHVDHALQMLEYAEREPGFCGGVMLTAGSAPPLGNRKYEPIYERMEEMGLPLALHTSGAGLDQYQGHSSFVETHTLGFLQSNQTQLVSMIFQGIPEKFPDLDIAFIESGITYLPGLAARMDEEWLKRTEEAPMLEKLPSDYVREDFYYTTQPLETEAEPEFLENCFDFVGDRLMYASDYPHWDFDRPTTVTTLPFLSKEEKQRILSGNAMEVFGL